jgi:hypothetical protein
MNFAPLYGIAPAYPDNDSWLLRAFSIYQNSAQAFKRELVVWPNFLTCLPSNSYDDATRMFNSSSHHDFRRGIFLT